MKKILVTGASGFIGNALVRSLREKYEVYGLGRKKSDTVSIIWNFIDEFPSYELPSNINVIIHAGGIVGLNNNYTKNDYNIVNVQSCKVLAEYGKNINVNQMIYLSTGGLYGTGPSIHNERDSIFPNNRYLNSKGEGENEFQKYYNYLNIVIIRLFFPYGPGQFGRLIPDLAEKISNGLPIQLNNSKGSPRINPIYLNDVIFVINRLIKMNYHGIINLSGPNIVSIRDITEYIGESLNKLPQYEILGIPSKDLLGNNTSLLNLLPDLELTNMKEGLSRTFLGNINDI